MLTIALAMTMTFQSAEVATMHAFSAAVDCLVRETHQANPGAVMSVTSLVPAREAVYAVAANCEAELQAVRSAGRHHYGNDDAGLDRWLDTLKERAVVKYYEIYIARTRR